MTITDAVIVIALGCIGFGGTRYLLKLYAKDKTNAPDQRISQHTRGKAGSLEWYEALGVPEDAEWSTVEAAYVGLSAQYHPEKFSYLGEEFQDLATKRTKSIMDAFEAAKSIRNIS